MAGTDAEDAFVLIEHGVDGGGIGLGTAGKEEYLSIGQTDRLTDKVLGVGRVSIESVGGGTGVVMANKGIENKGVGAVIVIAVEIKHSVSVS